VFIGFVVTKSLTHNSHSDKYFLGICGFDWLHPPPDASKFGCIFKVFGDALSVRQSFLTALLIAAFAFALSTSASAPKVRGGMQKQIIERQNVDRGQMEKFGQEKIFTEPQVSEKNYLEKSAIETGSLDRGKFEKPAIEQSSIEQMDEGEALFPHKNLHRKLRAFRNNELDHVHTSGLRSSHFRHHLYRGKADREVE